MISFTTDIDLVTYLVAKDLQFGQDMLVLSAVKVAELENIRVSGKRVGIY
jgi:hypothetical protein